MLRAEAPSSRRPPAFDTPGTTAIFSPSTVEPGPSVSTSTPAFEAGAGVLHLRLDRVHRAARARELDRAGADARRRGGHRVTEAQVREDRGHPAFERVEARVRAL